jgi:hypothetical protein
MTTRYIRLPLGETTTPTFCGDCPFRLFYRCQQFHDKYLGDGSPRRLPECREAESAPVTYTARARKVRT